MELDFGSSDSDCSGSSDSVELGSYHPDGMRKGSEEKMAGGTLRMEQNQRGKEVELTIDKEEASDGEHMDSNRQKRKRCATGSTWTRTVAGGILPDKEEVCEGVFKGKYKDFIRL